MIMVEGKRDNNQQQIQIISEVIRTQTSILITPNIKKGHSFKPRKSMPFPWDKQTEAPTDKPETIRERILKRDKKQALKKLKFTGK